MNPRNLAVVLISVIGIYACMLGIYQLPILFNLFISGFESNLTPGETVVYTLSLAGMYGSVGTVLLVFRKRIAAFIVEDTEPFTNDMNIDALQEVGFSILGLYFFIDGLSISRLLRFDDIRWIHFVDGGLWKSVLGLALFIGARRLLNIWKFLRQYRGRSS